MIDLSKYDFCDFGSGFGGCIDFVRKKFGVTKEIGFENHLGRCNALIKKGYNCYNRDITKLKLPKKSIDFITISHVLEHLDSIQSAKNVINLAINSSKKFVFIEGPSFEFDEYLKTFDLKFFWSDGHGHTSKVHIEDILSCINKNNSSGYSILREIPYITDSFSDDIHSIRAPLSVGKYDKKKHPPKNLVSFDKKLFRSFIVYIWLDNLPEIPKILGYRSKFGLHKQVKF